MAYCANFLSELRMMRSSTNYTSKIIQLGWLQVVQIFPAHLYPCRRFIASFWAWWFCSVIGFFFRIVVHLNLSLHPFNSGTASHRSFTCRLSVRYTSVIVLCEKRTSM